MTLQSERVQTFVVQKVTKQLSETLHAPIKIKNVNISFFNRIILNDVFIGDQKMDTLLFIGRMSGKINYWSLRKKEIAFQSIELQNARIKASSDTLNTPNYQFIINSLQDGDTISSPGQWKIKCDYFKFDQTNFQYSYYKNNNPDTLSYKDISIAVNHINFNPDSIKLHVSQLKLKKSDQFQINQFNTTFLYTGKTIQLRKLNLKTSRSKITNATIKLTVDSTALTPSLANTTLNLDLSPSLINFKDLSTFIPSLKGMDMNLWISGNISGKLSDLKARDLSLKTGKNTIARANLYVNGLPDLKNTYVYVDLNKLDIDFKDLENLKLPQSLSKDSLDIPTTLTEAGIISYEGNFTGFLGDFVAFGTLKSNFGTITSDLSFKPDKQNNIQIRGHLATVNFQLGNFTKQQTIGKVTFNGQLEGFYNLKEQNLNAQIKGLSDSLTFRHYTYHNIKLNGLINRQKFKGNLEIHDPNLDGKFTGLANFNDSVPKFDFNLLLNKANLSALNIDTVYSTSVLAMDIEARFSGNSFSSMNGKIAFKNGTYKNNNNSFSLKNLELSTSSTDSLKNISFHSDFADAELNGDYELKSIPNFFKQTLRQYIPALPIKSQSKSGNNKFQFQILVKNAEPILKTFYPDIDFKQARLAGSLNESSKQFEIKGTIPVFVYKGIELKNYSLDFNNKEKLSLISTAKEIKINNQLQIYNLKIQSNTSNNISDNQITWSNHKQTNFSGEIHTRTKFITHSDNPTRLLTETNILPTKIFVADSLWQISPSSISTDSTEIRIEHLKFSNGEQKIFANGELSNNDKKQLVVQINKLNLSNFNELSEDYDFNGVLNGKLSMVDVYQKAMVISDLNISGLTFGDNPFGTVNLSSSWNTQNSTLETKINVTDSLKKTLIGQGIYNPANDSININIDADSLSLAFLTPILAPSFTDIHGRAYGHLRIYGTSDKILMHGDVLGKNAGLKIDYTQVPYHFNHTVKFRRDSIIFDHIPIVDANKDTAIFNGSIRHDNFENMDYNMSLSSDKVLVLNTKKKDNSKFYGKAFGSGLLTITGHAVTVYLDARLKTLNGTAINISMNDDNEAQEYNFIRFAKSKNDSLSLSIPNSDADDYESKTSLNLNIDATPDAKFQLIYNSQIGDVIKGQGSGNLQLTIDPEENIYLYGNYRVDRGEYLFTLKNLINRKFIIGQGGTLNWNGDPYDATVDITASYRLKASLSELFGSSIDDDTDYSQRIPVICTIGLTNDLNNPTIKFNIELPNTEDRIKDEFSQFVSTEEEMNKQMLSLLVLGRFYTPEYLKGTYESSNPNLVGNTASELLSNQLSNWLSKLNSDVDIGVNYHPGDQLTDDELELALSTQIFNDRVTINGNIGNNGNQTTTANNNHIVGDFDLNVKLTNNGKLQFKAYNHSNTNILYETSPYTQGIGISYRENYDTFHELWQKLLHLFNFHKSKKTSNKTK